MKGQSCQMCLVLHPLGSSGDPRGKSKLSLFQQQALFQGCVTVSRCPVCSLPFQLQMPFPQGRSGNLHHEVCTAKTSAAPLLPALPEDSQHVLSHGHTAQPHFPPGWASHTAQGNHTFGVFRLCTYDRKGSRQLLFLLGKGF